MKTIYQRQRRYDPFAPAVLRREFASSFRTPPLRKVEMPRLGFAGLAEKKKEARHANA